LPGCGGGAGTGNSGRDDSPGSGVTDASVTILGQTDIIGTEDYNVALSVRRAQSVYQTVMDSGISSPERVTSKGNGPHDPPYDNASPEGRSFNRTVIITIEYETTE